MTSWTSYVLLLCIPPASYFAAGNAGAVVFWLLRPLRAKVIGYALTGAVLAAIVYPVVGFSVDSVGQLTGDLPVGEDLPPRQTWAYYQAMVTTFGLAGLFGGVWWWYQDNKTPSA